MNDIDYQLRPRERGAIASRRCGGAGGGGARGAKQRQPSSELARQIRRGFNGDACGGHVARSVAAQVARVDDAATLRAARELMLALERKESALILHDPLVGGAFRLARFHRQWLNRPGAWTPPAAGANAQFRALARHLLARYPVPGWLDTAWLTDFEPLGDARGWYVHVGRGGNLSKVNGLPFPLSTRAAHFASEAPGALTIGQALRWGQFRALGVRADVVAAVVQTRLARPTGAEPFWLTFGQWLALNPLPPDALTGVVDYVQAQRFGGAHVANAPPQPNFSFHGRTAAALLAQARQWHHQFALRRRRQQAEAEPLASWPGCGIAGWASPLREGETLPALVIRELTSAAELEHESAALGHCVWSYAHDAARGRVAVFSLRRLKRGAYRPVVTIEVWPDDRRVVQARGSANRKVDDDERKLVLEWTRAAGLSVHGAW